MHECAINRIKAATAKPLKIFVSGPYTDDNEAIRARNTQRAIDVGIELYKLGHHPYIPHLTHWVDKRARETEANLKWEDYMNYHLPWLERCDALYFIAPSRGANLELATAVNMGKVIFRRLDEIPVLPVQYRILGM